MKKIKKPARNKRCVLAQLCTFIPSHADLYQGSWAIEVFLKEIKQTLKLAGFIGYSKNAIAWQVWAALLV